MDPARAQLAATVAALDPYDEVEGRHRATTLAWIASGAPLHRTRKPDVPDPHLVSYVVPVDVSEGRLLLADHRLAGLQLPPGGHVEPGESPWRAALRECAEELGFTPAPLAPLGPRPLFVTVTRTRGETGRHTDVSLWFVVAADAASVRWYDEREFAGVEWLTPAEVLARDASGLDPHMHRCTRKLQRVLAAPPRRSVP